MGHVENEILKWRLQLWEELGAGGDQGQTDHVGHTLPCEVTAEIQEMDMKLKLSGSKAIALLEAGERAPLEQQHSEEEWGSSLLQETELTAAEGKEKFSEQHTESRQSVEDLDFLPMMKTVPESETPGLLVYNDFTENVNLDTNNITQGCNGMERFVLSVLEHKEELDVFNLTEQHMEPQLIDPAEQQTDAPVEEISTTLQHPEPNKLKSHWQTHKGERAFSCSQCERSFSC